MTQPLLFDTRHAAEYIGVSKRTMEDYIRNGNFRLVHLPTPDGKKELKKNFIKREDLDRFVEEQGKVR